jgi:hypothetical protein
MLIDIQMIKNFNTNIFSGKKKYESGGRFEVKIRILFYGEDSEPLHLVKLVQLVQFGTAKGHGHTYKFYLNHYFVWQSF